MQPANKTGIRRIFKAAAYSASGLRAAWSNEAAFRQECVLAAVLIPVAFVLGQNAVERSLLIGSCLMVLIVELLNSAVEAAIDRIGSERHELSGRAKDFGSAAVLLALVLTGCVWVLIGIDNLL
jgi:diacylglycerol kinase (ATP)